ncbi:hypothetical protein MIR68_010492 [Amoeboaphelidium protococcarum]|nr:hypothetical protein MIR68_010492 [Amoeboaphelidium protococcarum]
MATPAGSGQVRQSGGLLRDCYLCRMQLICRECDDCPTQPIERRIGVVPVIVELDQDAYLAVIKSSRAAVAPKIQFSQYDLDTSSKQMEVESSKVFDLMSEDQANDIPYLESSSKVFDQPSQLFVSMLEEESWEESSNDFGLNQEADSEADIEAGSADESRNPSGSESGVIMVKLRLILACLI